MEWHHEAVLWFVGAALFASSVRPSNTRIGDALWAIANAIEAHTKMQGAQFRELRNQHSKAEAAALYAEAMRARGHVPFVSEEMRRERE